MSESIENIVLLESNISNLKTLIKSLKKENIQFAEQLQSKEEMLMRQQNELKEWKEKYNSLKIANTFLGSNDKSLTKLKISNLKFEIDSIKLMSESIENIALLESNISKLKTLIKRLKKENFQFAEQLQSKDQILIKQQNELKELKQKYNSLKIANTFLGSNDKSLTRLKINNLIKELDKCILSLSS